MDGLVSHQSLLSPIKFTTHHPMKLRTNPCNPAVSSAYFYHLRHVRQLRYVVSKSTMQRIVSALVQARIDYCNSLLTGLPAITLAPLKRVMNAAVRLLARQRDHVTPAMREIGRASCRERVCQYV